MALSTTAETDMFLITTPNTTASVGSTTAENPWSEFGTLQIFEVIFLTLLTVLGTFGNLVVIFSIALEKRVHAHGNIFIINLAVADLIVTGFIVPTVIANVINSGNALDHVVCQIVAYLVTATCTCSLCNLMFIAINRYWAVVRPNTYVRTFSRRRVYYMVASTWLWSMIITSPTTYGWGGLKYDEKIMVCTWDDAKDKSYTYFLTILAVFCPLVIIGFCYFKLFSTVRSSGRWVRSLSVGSGISQNSEQHRRSMRKEQSLLRTLATTVVLFCIFWVPFAACVLINPTGTPAHAKKVFGWFALSNSCVNFIVYGAMNPVFRRGYHNLFIFLFRCKRVHKISSTMIHGSFSDSYRAVRKSSKQEEQRNGRSRVHGSHTKSASNKNFDNSRADTITAVQTQTTLATNSPAFLRSVKAVVISNGPPTPEQSRDVASSSNKRGFVQGLQSLRRTSLMRKNRARANTGSMSEDNQESRMKRNSAMLLQIQVGEENCSDEEELQRCQNERFSRRTMSDTPPRSKQEPPCEEEQNNSNHNNNNNNVIQLRENGSLEGGKNFPLRGTWIPKSAVYRSRESFRLPGKPAMKRSRTLKITRAGSDAGRRSNGIATVCGSFRQKFARRGEDDTAVVAPVTQANSPTKALLKSALTNGVRTSEEVSPPGRCPSPENDAGSESGDSLPPPCDTRRGEYGTDYSSQKEQPVS